MVKTCEHELSDGCSPMRAQCRPEDEIVISGMAGRFPNSHNIKEFKENLYNKVDMCDDDERRWRHEFPNVPKRSGKTYDIDKFDSSFFRINSKQAHVLDPQMRLLMEHAYEAILDAGINPESLRGTKTGVFVGACFAETESALFYDINHDSAQYVLTGLGRSMFANRLSYSMDLQGPSLLLDTACSSSLYALNAAFNAIRSGECEAAIVGATNATLHPYVTMNFSHMGVLAKDGVSRPFDEAASGYVRSEAFGCLFLQKAKDANRIYSTVVYSKTNCDGFKPESISYPSGDLQAELYESFYKDIGISPNTVAFVEAHSTGTQVGDPEECKAIDRVFCKNRKNPLPIGSTKSNMGHAESAAGLCSIAKCIFALENKLIPPNIHFTKARSVIEGFEKNRLQVVTEPQTLDGPLIAVNSFGFGGSNGHCLLRGQAKEKINDGRPTDALPRLVNWAGRTEEACNTIFDDISSRPLDSEFIGLIHNTQQRATSGNLYRSFGLFSDIDNENAKCLTREIQHFSGIKPKLVYVFSGMGSQWCEMGTQLLEIPLFKRSIEKCHDVLVRKGLNLMEIITSSNKATFNNVVHSFVGIAAIQIGIVDILSEIGIVPDIIVGHSVGELGCAYADGCLTAEEMILCAYSRGLATIETETIDGAMAAVGLGYQQIKSLVPQSIDVACHNGPNSSTISGPKEEVEKFVAELKAKKIFAKEVPAANRAFHSRYIADMGPKLMSYLNKIIKNPKERSIKWLSSSVPKDKWDLKESKYCSAEYQRNNLLSPVLFEETIKMLPNNAVTIEIAPHGLLQAILKTALSNCTNIPLTQRGNPNNHIFFLTALGKLFKSGIEMQIKNIYPNIEFPVSRGTPSISHLVKWNHTEEFFVMNINSHRYVSGEKRFNVEIESEDFAYILGHSIDGKCLFPGIAYLQFVWEVFARLHDKFYYDINVEFEDVKFLRATTIKPKSRITFVVLVNSGTGHFEVTEGSMAVVQGYVREVPDDEEVEQMTVPVGDNTLTLPTRDFYKELRLRGYHYNGLFKSILEARCDGLAGKVKWDNNWVTFIDCVLQLFLLQIDTRSLMLPTGIEKLTINCKKHFDMMCKQTTADDTEISYFEILGNEHLRELQSGGIRIKGIQAHPVARKFKSGEPILEEYKFVPNVPMPQMKIENVARICAQYVIEHSNKKKFKCVEVADFEEGEPLSELISQGFSEYPQAVADMTILSSRDIKSEIPIKNEPIDGYKNSMVAIATNYLSNLQLFETIYNLNFEYLILRETKFNENTFKPLENYNLIFVAPIEMTSDFVILLQKKTVYSKTPTVVQVSAKGSKFEWLEPLKVALKTGPTIVYSQNEKTSGIIGLVKSILQESPNHTVRCVFIDDVNAPPFDLHEPFYEKQLNLEMPFNIYRNEKWGTYRFLQFESPANEKSTSDHVFANITRRGDLTSFKWIEGPLNVSSGKKNAIKIQYAALNFRDVMLASGKISFEAFCSDRLHQECTMGLEFAGVAEKGDRVMGINMAGALSSHTAPGGILMWKCPTNWTLEQAATVPVVYSTVYVALLLRANIKKGNSILIHSGTGDVGLAAIQVCLAYGLTVFTTVGSAEKREFLLNNFTELRDSHIGNSRDLTFEKMVKCETHGRGVDFVLNSLSGDKLTASIRCLAAKGKFLEIGKFDLINDYKIGLREFLREITFHSVHLDNMSETSLDELEAVNMLIDQDIKRGIIKPLPSTVFLAHDVQSAFRFLGSGKHIGKVLIKIRENPHDNTTLPVPIIPRLYCNPESSYIIIGGLGGFGLELTDWLIVRGARKLVLSSRYGISKPYQSHRINLWKSYGVSVTIATSDISTRAGCTEVIKEAHKLGPLIGIFNLGARLKDELFENQTIELFNIPFGAKSDATEHLDQLSRALCPRLKYFVVFSSIATGRGNNHQSNYSMTNSIMERIIEQRRADNLPGIAVQWGAVGDVGIVADLQEDNLVLEIGGTLTQGINSCLEELDKLLFSKTAIVSSMILSELKKYGADMDIKTVLMKILGIHDINAISMDAKLSELGMDSMTAVEIKQTLEREFDIILSAPEIKSLTFGKLLEYQEKIKKKSNGDSDASNEDNADKLFRELGDEASSGEAVLQLKTKNVTNTTSAVIFMPGLESVASEPWRNIAGNLKHPTFCFQLQNINSFEEMITTISEAKNNLIAKLGKNIKHLYIVGHSFGSLLALYLADALLCTTDLKQDIILIDGSPEYNQKWMARDFPHETIQITILSTIYQMLFENGNVNHFSQTLMGLSSFETRLEKLLEHTSTQNKYSTGYIKQLAVGIYNRLRIQHEINLEQVPTIKSKITLARSTTIKPDVDMDESYGLKRYTNHSVDLKSFDGDQTGILANGHFVAWLQEFCV